MLKSPILLIRKDKKFWALMAFVFVVGVFLRVYNLHDWMNIQEDQVRDLKLTQAFIDGRVPLPLLGPDMSAGKGFHLGPIYYYFQLISAKIFGVGFVQQTLPDLFFAIFSIPLLYYFLNVYFKRNLVLLATAVYACSYFVILYSRFPWNVNLIPFFSILFLLSFAKFIELKEKTAWTWIILLGISWGIGIQLHAIILVIFMIMMAGALLWAIFKKPVVWKKSLVVIFIAVFLNAPQLASEFRTNFSNTKSFFVASSVKSERESNKLRDMTFDLACNADANVHILSALGDNRICYFLYSSEDRSITYKTPIQTKQPPVVISWEVLSVILFVFGVFLLIKAIWQEKDLNKKYFLGTIFLYQALFFLVMIPVAPGSRMRYYLPITIMPFIFLLLLFKFLLEKFPQKGKFVIGSIFTVLILLNFGVICITISHLLSAQSTDVVFRKLI